VKDQDINKSLINLNFNEKFKGCLIDFISIVKDWAIEAKKDADNRDVGNDDFNQGFLMAYCSILSLIKHEAWVFDIDPDELGLADFNPEEDLLGIRTRTDINPQDPC